MTPPIFHIDDEVEIIGPTRNGADMCIGQKIIIEELNITKDATYYSDKRLPWYPASSLRLVAEELKTGDWVEIVGQPCGLERKPIGMTGKVLGITCGGNYELANWIYPASSLRKLTPEEVAFHTGTIEYKMQECSEEIEKATEAMRDLLAPLVDERLAAIEKRLDDQEASIKSLRFHTTTPTEKWMDEIDSRLNILEGERPEVCDCPNGHQIPNGEPIHIVIVKGDKMHTWCDTCPVECLAWCEKVLDSIREG